MLTAAGTEVTPRQARDRLGGQLAYTTVMTVLTRLAAKGLVIRTRAGRGYAYRAVVEGAEVTARRMRGLLDADGDRAAVLVRFVDALSDEDERLLAHLLARAQQPDDDATTDR